ncbi:protein SPT2 homolog [Centruroides vittatus]|uniref:protein SPT2 homolog n=1 Tax=Centruroides vittatus TaxID=120091 RepID=UPI00350FD30C
MDFANLLELAKQNSEDASKQASVKRYSTNLKPSKKLEKGNVKSSAIKAFLARKEVEEKVKEKEAYYKKEELLSIRSQNSKNSKKAKLMASRTKDNDFSKIRLTTEEEDAKKKIDHEIQKRMISDKIERMKARIELEEKEKLLPRKRKRKSKANENNNGLVQVNEQIEDFSDYERLKVEEKKMQRSSGQPMNFHDLLKLASQKQHEPVELPKVVKKEERPMTEKEKRRYEEEQLRKRGISVYTLPDINRQKSKQKKLTSSNGDTSKTSVFSESIKNKEVKTSQPKSNILNNKTVHTVKKTGGSYQDVQLENRKVPNYEDDDLDDFIDDTPIDENIDVSRQIQEIFRYNKNKYRDDDYDDDDDIMESSFVQQMKEECRSARIGMMEDLEDIQREKEEMKRKMMKKKTLKR